ncbi:hypothetical protein [Erythrobacter aureus]|uniref:Uncharacterized protein n=1 Tax=Erythrobacter aureus TaxID=2182384 RepID=A0A345YD82_9SPHN|nr:hypothetical protein [Erythrobacter aureus]AXK41884.1 hypothetical protein DVR09_05595 [Erythrobacter aureus]
MATAFTIGILIVYGVLAHFLIVLVLNIAGLPGVLLAGKPGIRSKRRFIAGSIVSAAGQSYLCLAFTAFVVNWTMLAIDLQGASIIAWPFAFLCVVLPLWINFIRARLEDQEQEHANAQVEALHITVIATLLGFFLFAFFPSLMPSLYSWVPYVKAF